ncbi:ANTAR domain-containing protein [Agromyces fucosus]|uniref:ANTAR domain-containing protein n=1 Tax=Agromyces fucosus TaxID=41985 RepID=A0A4Q2JQ15_9MICO|nr:MULTISPECIES: GAF and ANTAR domain-containing protein [Agromyces]KQZ10869.1 transcriptional regulator [Agromyces sp. Root1464]RXZ48789.1 ANTAR domain-containing protein [Agromyces fucosus]
MNSRTREQELLRTFASLADTLVEGYDVVELLQLLVDSCQQLLDTTAAAILLADADGELDVIASTSEASRLVELIQIGAEAGPCVESFTTGTFVSVPDISDSPERWGRFRDGAIAQGFASVHAFPMRLRETRIGTLNLLRDSVGELDPDDRAAAQAFADVATIGILHERSIHESHVLSEQLERALQSRVVIEQAKGVVAHTRGVPIEEAFTLIRAYARANRIGISQVAAGLVDRSLALPE